MGFRLALAAGAELLNGCNALWPSVPSLPIKRLNLAPLLTDRPWSGLGETNLSWYPFAIGLSFIMPVELSVLLLAFFSRPQGAIGAGHRLRL